MVRPNNLAFLSRLFIVVNGTGLNRDLCIWREFLAIPLIGNDDEFITARSGSLPDGERS